MNNTKMKKAVLIAGASSGIGKACATLLDDSENSLYLLARNTDSLKELQHTLSASVHIIPYDLNDMDGIKNIFKEIKEENIKLDALIYTAGMDSFSPVKVTNTKTFQNVMDINCFAFCEMARCFFNRQISKDGAGIVAVSSIASLLSKKGQIAYTASKSALNSVIKTMAQEFGSRKIRVNAILPAGVSTVMANNKGKVMAGMPEPKSEEKNPQFLGAIPADIVAENILFLLSDKSAYTTGELLTIGAGYNY